MRIILKILGLVCVIIAVFFGLCSVVSMTNKTQGTGGAIIIILLLIMLIFAGLAFYCFKKSKPSVQVTIEETTPISSKPTNRKPSLSDESIKRYSFNVAGISHHEDEIIDRLLIENDEYSMSKKDLIEMGMEDTKIFRYEGLSTNVQLIPEPDNEYDKNAIKVVADGVHIGYVPSKETATIKELLNIDDLKIGCSFYGGEYKILYTDSNTVKKEKWNIGAKVTLAYKQ